MLASLKYDGRVKPLNRASVVGFVLLFAGSTLAQINAAPPSVTSLGFGGRAINGTPPSVTSLGPRGYTPGFNPAFPNSHPTFGVGPNNGHHHHRNGSGAVYAIPYAYPYYGYYDSGEDANASEDEQYNGGPTMFDRRGPGPAVPPSAQNYSGNDIRTPAVADAVQPEEPPAQNQPETVLVFKDGHQLEVANYAIVGQTLYDLTDGHRRRIPLSDLDLDATSKQNDERGVDFQLPSGS